jgi:hypothetical protein
MRVENNGTGGRRRGFAIHAKSLKLIKLLTLSRVPLRPGIKHYQLAAGEIA